MSLATDYIEKEKEKYLEIKLAKTKVLNAPYVTSCYCTKVFKTSNNCLFFQLICLKPKQRKQQRRRPRRRKRTPLSPQKSQSPQSPPKNPNHQNPQRSQRHPNPPRNQRQRPQRSHKPSLRPRCRPQWTHVGIIMKGEEQCRSNGRAKYRTQRFCRFVCLTFIDC